MTTELQPSEPGVVETDSTDIGALNAHTRPRRTLDDMRRLSETILRNRRYAK